MARQAATTSRSVTIKDVARGAGVSVATVSRVLNDSGPVREATRRRVWEVASSLRYTPNEAARSLITRSTRTLGVVLPDLHGEFFSEVIRGIDQRAQQERFHLLVSGSHNERQEIEAALRAMRRRVDGLVLMSPDIDAAGLEANLPHNLPLVLLNCAIGATAVPTITIDNFGGATAMVRHLVGLGHRRIGFIAGPARNYDAAERLRGYREAMREAGLDPAGSEEPGDFTESGGHRGAARLLARPARPTAIFAANDAMAVGAMSALREAGVSIPDDVAVAGFDDIPIARYLSPALTSVHVPIAELGARAVERLFSALAGRAERARRPEVLGTRLVVRRSCGASA
ncbi:MAG TPA: LacI family DNA-binding transcriptional regulator [Longimicrobiales bacterium]|nr:LacI family DNA-binding transcriptional regulator [Longimicrobiales bacterium]